MMIMTVIGMIMRTGIRIGIRMMTMIIIIVIIVTVTIVTVFAVSDICKKSNSFCNSKK